MTTPKRNLDRDALAIAAVLTILACLLVLAIYMRGAPPTRSLVARLSAFARRRRDRGASSRAASPTQDKKKPRPGAIRNGVRAKPLGEIMAHGDSQDEEPTTFTGSDTDRQYLVERWPDGLVTIAIRTDDWDTWSPPTALSGRTWRHVPLAPIPAEVTC